MINEFLVRIDDTDNFDVKSFMNGFTKRFSKLGIKIFDLERVSSNGFDNEFIFKADVGINDTSGYFTKEKIIEDVYNTITPLKEKYNEEPYLGAKLKSILVINYK